MFKHGNKLFPKVGGQALSFTKNVIYLRLKKKRTNQHLTLQKNTDQLDNVLLLDIHHSHNTSDAGVG